MVIALSRLSLLLLLALAGCGVGLHDAGQEPADDPFGGSGGLFGADDDDSTGADDGLPTPQGPYEGETFGRLAGEACSGYAWVFVGADGAVDGSFDCVADDLQCSFSIDGLSLDELGELVAPLDSCQGEVTLRLDAFDSQLSASVLSDLVSIEFFANHTPEEGD